jgi:uncharacterized membrane protein
MGDLSKKKHVIKTITWRLIATGTTVVLAWIISGNVMVGLHVGGWEFFIKMALYYLHERAWHNLDLSALSKKRNKKE